MKIRIDKIYKNDSDKDGKKFLDKNGNSYRRINIYSNGEVFSALEFDQEWNDIQVGDEIECEVSEKKVGDRTYKNISLPKPSKEDISHDNTAPEGLTLKGLDKRISDIEGLIKKKSNKEIPMKEEKVDRDDLPF